MGGKNSKQDGGGKGLATGAEMIQKSHTEKHKRSYTPNNELRSQTQFTKNSSFSKSMSRIEVNKKDN